MANPTNAVNLDQYPTAYQATHAPLLVFKASEDASLDSGDVAERSAAEWPNHADDFELRVQQRLTGLVVNAAEHGVDPANADNADEMNAALAAARSVNAKLHLPPGTITCLSELDAANVYIEGSPGTVLDFDGANPANFAGGACIRGAGSLIALPDLASDVSEGELSVTFDSDVSGQLSAGDYFAIFDPTDSSFNPARAQYRAGEWCRVSSVSGATVTIDRPAQADYAAATVTTHRLAPGFLHVEGVEIRGIGTTTTIAVLEAALCADVVLKNLTLSGSQWAHAFIDRCVGVRIDNVSATDYGAVGVTNYGIALDSVRDAVVTGCRISVRRHAITLNSIDDTAGVPCRDVTVAGCVLTGTDHTAIDAHGAAERYAFLDCYCHGGISVGGDRATIRNCYATGSTVSSGAALRLTETIGADFVIEGCDFRETVTLDSNRGLLDWGGNSTDAIVLASRAGSRFRIIRNRIQLASGLNAMILRHRGTLTDDVRATIAANDVRRPAPSGQTSTFMQVRGDPASDHFWRSVEFLDNDCDGVGIFVQNVAAEEITVRGGSVRNAGDSGVRITGTGAAADFPWGGADGDQTIIVKDVKVREAQMAGINVQGWDDAITHAKILGNVSIANGQAETGVSSERSSLYLRNCEVATVKLNTWGDDQGTVTQVRSWAAEDVELLVESDNTLVGAPLSANLTTNIGRLVSRVYQTGSGGNAYNVEGQGTAAPASGTWIVGDRIWNSTPAVGQPIGWMCTVNGSPGTWVALANL